LRLRTHLVIRASTDGAARLGLAAISRADTGASKT
jgi:hypothetical protein